MTKTEQKSEHFVVPASTLERKSKTIFVLSVAWLWIGLIIDIVLPPSSRYMVWDNESGRTPGALLLLAIFLPLGIAAAVLGVLNLRLRRFTRSILAVLIALLFGYISYGIFPSL